jgi:hypothetical protein
MVIIQLLSFNRIKCPSLRKDLPTRELYVSQGDEIGIGKGIKSKPQIPSMEMTNKARINVRNQNLFWTMNDIELLSVADIRRSA